MKKSNKRSQRANAQKILNQFEQADKRQLNSYFLNGKVVRIDVFKTHSTQGFKFTIQKGCYNYELGLASVSPIHLLPYTTEYIGINQHELSIFRYLLARGPIDGNKRQSWLPILKEMKAKNWVAQAASGEYIMGSSGSIALERLLRYLQEPNYSLRKDDLPSSGIF